jgi:outer membrane cobalamin receptor
MRGLGSGFTQLLIDGQRLPPGFSLDSLTPEQIERIEILRAPTAETGAQAIAGTINIITREGFQKRLNDLRIGTGVENGKPSLGTFWSHNDNSGSLTYTLSAVSSDPAGQRELQRDPGERSRHRAVARRPPHQQPQRQRERASQPRGTAAVAAGCGW